LRGEASDVVVVMVKVVGQTNQDWDYVWWAKFVLYNHPELSVRVLWNFATSCVDFETRFLPENPLSQVFQPIFSGLVWICIFEFEIVFLNPFFDSRKIQLF